MYNVQPYKLYKVKVINTDDDDDKKILKNPKSFLFPSLLRPLN